jgi:uncharacterized protein (TIGR02246 family)
MTRRAIASLLLGMGGVLTGACSMPEPESAGATATAGAAREVAAADSAWSAAAASRNLEASVGTMAEDGIMFPPGQPPVIGRAAVRAFMQEGFAMPGFSASWVTDTVVVASSGDLAYSIGRSRYTFPDSTGGIDTMHAKGVAVWRREADGQWRAVADIWNESPELPRIVPAAAAR